MASKEKPYMLEGFTLVLARPEGVQELKGINHMVCLADPKTQRSSAASRAHLASSFGDNHDAHVIEANRTFRDCGFTLAAMQYKRSPEALAALRKFNRGPDGWQHPFAWNFHPNEWCRDNWRSYLPPSSQENEL